MLALLKPALAALSGPLRLARAYPWQALCLVLLCLSAWLWHGRSAARQQIARIEAAQHQAAADQAAVNHQPAATSAAIAEASNAQAPAYYRAVRIAGDAQRLRHACPASRADLPGTDRAAALDDRSPAAAELVSRPKADDDLILAAAGRAAQMHADAQALIANGAAVAVTSK